jgi:hypothetical protein
MKLNPPPSNVYIKPFDHSTSIKEKERRLVEAGFEVVDVEGVKVVLGIRTSIGFQTSADYKKMLGPFPVYPNIFNTTAAGCAEGMHMLARCGNFVSASRDSLLGDYIYAACLLKDTAGGGEWRSVLLDGGSYGSVNKIRAKKMWIAKRRSTLINNIKRYLKSARYFGSEEY